MSEYDSAGNLQISSGVVPQKITVSGGKTYIATRAPDPSKTRAELEAEARWRAYYVDANGSIFLADGDAGFNNIATDLTALSYQD